ncbi:MAG: response regulator transcription factor [Acidobacteria bacterium]|nr:response regulator transcription factor [Acidobacteriota bacterium]
MLIRTMIVEDEPLARATLREFAAEFDWLALVGEAADGRAAVDLINALKPDLVLLDVQIPEMSGLEVLNRARCQPAVVFTTAYDKYAVDAFELEAFDYLLKPFGRARFRAAMERVRRRLQEKISPPLIGEQIQLQQKAAALPKELLTRLFVREKNSIVPLKIDDIIRFEADDDYVRVFAGNRSYLISQTLGEIESRLDASRFCRVHRSIIVNLEFVERAEAQDRRLLIVLKDKTEILASRSGSQMLRKLIF